MRNKVQQLALQCAFEDSDMSLLIKLQKQDCGKQLVFVWLVHCFHDSLVSFFKQLYLPECGNTCKHTTNQIFKINFVIIDHQRENHILCGRIKLLPTMNGTFNLWNQCKHQVCFKKYPLLHTYMYSSLNFIFNNLNIFLLN